MNGWVTVPLAAEALNRPQRTIRTWIRRGRITAACHLRTRTVLVDAWDVWNTDDLSRHPDKPHCLTNRETC